MTVALIPQVFSDGKTSEGTQYTAESLRVQQSNKTVQNKNGSQVQATAKFFFSPDTNINAYCKILYNNRKLEILTFYQVYDIDGNLDHYEVTV